MTVAELKAYTGEPGDGRAMYLALDGENQIRGWTGPVDGVRGWWWAIVSPAGGRIVALGWAAGSTRDLRSDVERKLRGLRADQLEVA